MRIKGLITAALMAGVAAFAPRAQAAPIDGSKYAVIAPTFYNAAGTGTQSYIRLFSGAGSLGATSNFSVTVVGVPSGNVYGTVVTVPVPFLASVQYSVGQLLGFANAGALANGDTSYAIYLKNTDVEAGYQHVSYSSVSNLFENLSICATPLNERLSLLHSEIVLPNVHTSKIAGGSGAYPSTIFLYNYGTAPATYTLRVFNGGNPGASGPSVSANAGKFTCQYSGNTSVPANSMLAIPESAIEASSGCTMDSDEYYANILISNDTGSLTLTPSHLVHAAAYGGDSNLTGICAVNRSALFTSAAPFIVNASAGSTFALTAPASFQSFAITGFSASSSGRPVVTGTLAATATGTVLTSSTGFTLTTADGKSFVLATTPGTSGFDGPNHYEANSADGARSVEIYLADQRVSTLASSTFGYYVENDTAADAPVAVGTLIASLPTTTVPTVGTQNYTGNVTGVVATSSDTGQITGGTVAMTINFAAKTFTGSITNVTVAQVQGTGLGNMSNINLTGTITGNTFTGTATAVAPAGGATYAVAGATGTVSGSIAGANALEVVGNLPLSGGGATVLATFGAHP